MATTIDDTAITSSRTAHTARLAASGDWTVTWTGRTFGSRNEAITAITVAEVFVELYLDLYRTAGNDQHMHQSWPLFADLADELGMAPDRAWRDLADTYTSL